MRPPMPRRRVLLSVLAACLVLLHHATTPATAAVATCAPKTCGNVTLAYPFWLTDASQPATPCGPSAFQVDCLAGGRAALARSFRGGYKILRVSYADRTVVIANDNVQTDATGCPVPSIDVSASLSLAPFSASAANRQLLFLFNCTPTPQQAGFANVACPGTPAVVRLDARYNTSASRAVAGKCAYAVVPVVGSLTPGGSAGVEYPRLLKEGYLLEWRASAGDCEACSDSGGRCGYDSGAEAFACVCADGSSSPARCDAKKSSKKVILIVSLSITFGLLLACLVTALKFHRRIRSFSYSTIMDRKTSAADNANVEKLLKKYGSLAPRRYRYSELKKITNSFKDKLGEGGYGTVYSGTLPRDHRKVAVKFLHHSGPKGEEFLNEVISIGRTSHVNIVTLLGFCLEGSKRALVYENMPNGSLDRYIYSLPSSTTPPTPVKKLGWKTLEEIAIGVARGLEYLHEGCNTRIIHFDVKPHNVLLDEGFRPKVADFGMAKLCDPKESILTMADARGTVGFIAPEVFSRGFGIVSAKSDVYSYGMLLLEMVGGRSNVKAYAAEKEADLFFPLWIYDYMVGDGGVLVVREDGGGGDEEMIARKMAMVGLWCIQTVPTNRPSMSRVLEMLERSIHELPMAPRPYHPSSPSNSPSLSHSLPSSYPSSASGFTQRSSSLTPESSIV